MVAILVLLTAVMFVLQHISPAGPGARAARRAGLGAGDRRAARTPSASTSRCSVQFWHYLTGLLHGDLGTSYRTRPAVASDLGDFCPPPLELALYGLVIALLLAVLLAVQHHAELAGRRRAAGCVLFTGASTPMFLLGIVGDRVLPAARLAAGDRAHQHRGRADRPDRPAHRRRPARRAARTSTGRAAPPAAARAGDRHRAGGRDRPGAALQPAQRRSTATTPARPGPRA